MNKEKASLLKHHFTLKQLVIGVTLLIAIFLAWYITIPALLIWWLIKTRKNTIKTRLTPNVIAVIIIGGLFFALFAGTGIAYYRDETPSLQITGPTQGQVIKNSTVVIKGEYQPSDRKVWINDKQINTSNGSFEFTYNLVVGINRLKIEAGNWKKTEQTLTITRELSDEEVAQRQRIEARRLEQKKQEKETRLIKEEEERQRQAEEQRKAEEETTRQQAQEEAIKQQAQEEQTKAQAEANNLQKTEATPETDKISEDTPNKVDNIYLKLNVWDDTQEQNLHNRFEIWTKGKGSWFPDTSFGADNTTIGPYSTDDVLEIFVYPDSRDGNETSFNISITEETKSESDIDAITVVIEDTKITVTSRGLEGVEQEFFR